MEIEVSVVSPLYNEKDNARLLVETIRQHLSTMDVSYEIVLVDDGSSDGTWRRIHDLSNEYSEVVGVRLSRNFGHQGALLAGLGQARGKAIISMDGDMQHPPELLPRMIELWRNGTQIVLTKRAANEKTTAFKEWSSKTFYKIFSMVADTRIESGASDFRLLDRAVLNELLELRYGQPFLRGAVQTLGFSKSTIEYVVGDRHSGQSKYTLKKMLHFARSGVISHSHVPLRFGIYLGLFTALFSVAELLYVLTQWMSGHVVQGWASTLGLISLLFSVVFFMLGILGLYIEDIHILLKKSPHYIVAEVVGDDVPPKNETGTM